MANAKIIIKIQQNPTPDTYYSFSVIELKYINTFQGWSINIHLFNIFIQLSKDRCKRTKSK